MTNSTGAKVQFGLILIAHALGAMSLLSVLTAGPQLMVALALTPLQLGGLASVYSASLAAASLPTGLLTDRLGIRKSLILAAMIITSGLLLSATSQGLGQLSAGIALCGAGYGLINPAAGLAITFWFSQKWRTTLLSLKQTGVPAGAAVGSLTAVLGTVWGWQVGIILAAAFSLIAGMLFVLFLPSDGNSPERTTPHEGKLAEVLTLPGLGRANIAAGLTNGIQFALWAHIPALLQQSYEAGATLLGLSLAALHSGTFVGRVVWGALTDRFMRGNSAYALWWLCLLGLAGVAILASGTLIASPVLAVIACFILGFTTCAAVGLHVALTATIAPENLLGGAMGYTMLVTNIGGIAVPMLLGFAVLIAGMTGAVLTLTILLSLALVILRKFISSLK